jgi:hypothetical protein
MSGKMGARPLDFNEIIVKESPTYQKWLKLEDGDSLRYSSRDFIKGRDKDEERLLRRINIARRYNSLNHKRLSLARNAIIEVEDDYEGSKAKKKARFSSPVAKKRKAVARSTSNSMTKDEILRQEMDVPAVKATRSYKTWLKLEDGKEFTYGEKYCKGKVGHDWMLKKNIWRRMNYRRENRKLVEAAANVHSDQSATTTQIVDEAHIAAARNALNISPEKVEDDTAAIIDAAVAALAAAESFILETESVSANTAIQSGTVAAVHKSIIDVPVVSEEEQSAQSERTKPHF